MDSLAAKLKKGGVRDLLLFCPVHKRELPYLEAHFKNAGLPQVVDWYVKRQYAIIKEGVISHLKEMVDQEESNEAVCIYPCALASRIPPDKIHGR